MRRDEVHVDGVAASYLTAGSGPPVLLLHGTYWSRVWQPVIDLIAEAGLRPIAVDLPGCGRSRGRLDLHSATVPALTAWVERFASALGLETPLSVAGHDIGGALAQKLVATAGLGVERLVLMNSVTYDSWPVPGVARFRDPAVVDATTTDELLALRAQALETAVHRRLSGEEREDYLSPWTDRRVAESWMALAGAADPVYTLELLDDLCASRTPKLLIWGEADSFQPIHHAERLARESHDTTLVRIADAGHIPTENDPARVANALVSFLGR